MGKKGKFWLALATPDLGDSLPISRGGEMLPIVRNGFA